MNDLCAAALAYARANQPDLTMRQLGLLGLICDEPGQSVDPLAKLLGVSRPVITRANHTLAEMGFITTAQREDDRRKVSVIPTEEGMAFRQRLGSL